MTTGLLAGLIAGGFASLFVSPHEGYLLVVGVGGLIGLVLGLARGSRGSPLVVAPPEEIVGSPPPTGS
jgi:uncharacterized membrane protein YccC